MIAPHPKVVNSSRKICKMFPNGAHSANGDDPQIWSVPPRRGRRNTVSRCRTNRAEPTRGGGGWLASMGVADFSGGYVIHLAAGTSGFVAAWLVGPRLQADREHFPPNSILITLVGAGILWLGWEGFDGGGSFFS